MLVFKTRASIPEVGALPGDLILIDPHDHDHPLAVYRSFQADAVKDVMRRLSDLDLVDVRARPHSLEGTWGGRIPRVLVRSALNPSN